MLEAKMLFDGLGMTSPAPIFIDLFIIIRFLVGWLRHCDRGLLIAQFPLAARRRS
jgi:hypothetical protein